MMYCIVRKSDRRIIHINGSIYGTMYRDDPGYEYIPIPDQDVSHLFQEDPELGWIVKEAYYPDDVKSFPVDGRLLSIDRDTGQKINSEVHPLAGLEEQIGILRDQLVHVLNALGIEPTEEFAKLNEIAIKEIEAAREKKEAVDAKDDTA